MRSKFPFFFHFVSLPFFPIYFTRDLFQLIKTCYWNATHLTLRKSNAVFSIMRCIIELCCIFLLSDVCFSSSLFRFYINEPRAHSASNRNRNKKKTPKRRKTHTNNWMHSRVLVHFGKCWFGFFSIWSVFSCCFAKIFQAREKKVHNKRQSSIMCAIVAQWPIYAWR